MSEYSTIEAEIEKHGTGIFTNVGDSMMPLLRQRRDIIHISKVEGRLKNTTFLFINVTTDNMSSTGF
ncbi:MAG: hypothetical protein MSA01_03690 [Anaeromassilibacillus sp.]|nr:hypothetical protein [Anaeromassilibacillus sp.]MDY3779679.1 hypothetical protein [Candidatus Limousia pullorum]